MITIEHITLGAKIRALRGLYYISQARLAERVGTDQRTISLFERDLAVPNDEVKQAMENVFGIKFDAFHITFGPKPQLKPTDQPIAVAVAA